MLEFPPPPHFKVNGGGRDLSVTGDPLADDN